MALTLSDVTFSYPVTDGGESPAVSGVSLEVNPGELVLIVGSTGSGKSTLMRVAAGLLAPNHGEVALEGAPIASPTGGGAIGLVFQDAESQLFAETLIDDVAFGPKNLGCGPAEAADRARAALARVGLPPEDFAERSPFQLSGGEARRAAIAGVLAMRPRYLLADEPTAGLDAGGRRAVRSLISELRADTGVVVVTHTADEFLDAADRVLVLSAGACAWYGPAAHLMEDPSPLRLAHLRPPDLLDLQMRGLSHGLYAHDLTLDPELLAERLAAELRTERGES